MDEKDKSQSVQNQPSDASRQRRRDRIFASLITVAVAALIVLFLVFGTIVYRKELLSMPPESQLATLQEDELFVEPEILEDLGEPDAVEHDEPAPAYKGEPEPAPVEQTKQVVPGKNPKPAPPEERKIDQTKKPSEVKSTEPKVSKEEKQKVTSAMSKFSTRNGQKQGHSGSSGSGGSGAGISGVASGRSFLGCPKPQVTLRHKVIVTVNVTIDGNGRVTSARAKGGADASIRRACEAAAMQARWSEKKDAPATKGTITFSITPR